MSGFPTQLPWRRFVQLLRNLGYRPLKSHRGSVRQFINPTRNPNLVPFHEPHSGDTLHKATLYDSLRSFSSGRVNLFSYLASVDNNDHSENKQLSGAPARRDGRG